MDYESQISKIARWVLGATGLGAIAAMVMLPKPFGLWVGLTIVVLFVLLFGGYYSYQRIRARRQREKFSAAIEAQAAGTPRTISDPNKRAELDRLRQKFQKGLQEFRSRGKDIYKLPWYVIIGESGSGKTEAIRHSGIDFPPGLQDELQGSGGTVNMDWWFTNQGIILDTAGSMIFSETRATEAPEWREFLRLLRKARPHCPINGLFLVLSVESLIKDSADLIAQKASKLAQQLDLVQRTLDVRFPVYLLITKSDLLTGFREFFDGIQDPLLQHQIFGWSNPDPLDAHFRPDLVEEHLKSIAAKLRRRRLALIRETIVVPAYEEDTTHFFATAAAAGGGGAETPRRMDTVDALFALPESVLRLAPRLRRYLETIFVAGEWSARPVFLRGIYFTSSMREGKALDEAIAFATGLPLELLPEERRWEKNRAFFLRDLFVEKVFRESGLVTRATNTLKLLRQRQLLIFGAAGMALLLLLLFAWFGFGNLKASVLAEARYWKAGANQGWQSELGQPVWMPLVRAGSYVGTNLVTKDLTLEEYHQRLRDLAQKPLSVGWIFKPVSWISRGVKNRPQAQRALFERSVIGPLVWQTRARMEQSDLEGAGVKAVDRHREALLALIRLEVDGRAARANRGLARTNAEKYLEAFLSYLTDSSFGPVPTNLVDTFAWTYSPQGSGANAWPPPFLLGGDSLTNNAAIARGLASLHQASQTAKTNIQQELEHANQLADALAKYHRLEMDWLGNKPPLDPCGALQTNLAIAKANVDEAWRQLESSTNFTGEVLTNLAACYTDLEKEAQSTSSKAFDDIQSVLPRDSSNILFKEIRDRLATFTSEATENVRSSYDERRNLIGVLDTNYVKHVAQPGGGDLPAYQARWRLYTNACRLANPITVDENMIGDGWQSYTEREKAAANYLAGIRNYRGPLATQTSNVCARIAGQVVPQARTRFVTDYVGLVTRLLKGLPANVRSFSDVTNSKPWLEKVRSDLSHSNALLPEDAQRLVAPVQSALTDAQRGIARAYVAATAANLRPRLKFPVRLAASDSLTPGELIALRREFDRIAGELNNPIWGDFAAGKSELEVLRTNPCHRVVNALVDEDGSLAEMKLFLDQSDPSIRNVFRKVRVTLGSDPSVLAGESSADVTRPSTDPLASGPLDRGLKIAFYKHASDKEPSLKLEGFPDWGLVRLLRVPDPSVILQSDGPRWVLKIKLEDPSQKNISGMTTFKFELKNRTLPSVEDWQHNEDWLNRLPQTKP